MPKYKVRVRQYMEEIAETIIEAANEEDAENKAAEFEDWNWEDGTDSGEFMVTKIELVSEFEDKP